MYWCSRKQRTLKTKSPPSELTPFSTDNIKTNRPKEIKLIPILPNLHLDTSDINENTSSSSSTTDSTKTLRRKNLLQQRYFIIKKKEKLENLLKKYCVGFFFPNSHEKKKKPKGRGRH
jgi:hypothetical protein